MGRLVPSVIGKMFGQGNVIVLAQGSLDLPIGLGAILQEVRAEHGMKPRNRVAQHRKGTMPFVAVLPLAQRFLVKLRGQGAEPLHPTFHALHRATLNRQKHQRRILGRHVGRHSWRTSGFEVRHFAKIEQVDVAHRLDQLVHVADFVGQRLGVLLLVLARELGDLVLGPQKLAQPIHNINILRVFIIDIERRLASLLQPTFDLHLEGLVFIEEILKLAGVKLHAELLGILAIGQRPLLRGPGYSAADIAFHLVTRQDHLGAARIVDHMLENAHVVVVEEPETGDAVSTRLHLLQQLHRVLVPLLDGDAKQLFQLGFHHEIGVKRLAIALDPVELIQIAFQKVGPRAHFSKDDETVEFLGHITLSPNRA